jgi:hypothetical protein
MDYRLNQVTNSTFVTTKHNKSSLNSVQNNHKEISLKRKKKSKFKIRNIFTKIDMYATPVSLTLDN